MKPTFCHSFRFALLSSACFLAQWSGPAQGASLADDAAKATVEGRRLDLPAAYPDGSLRFHLAVGALAENVPMVPVPAGGTVTSELVFEDTFDAADRSPWQDVLGTTSVADGQLVADSERNHVLVRDVQESDVRVCVDGQSAAQMAILVRYADANNFVMAFYTPAAKVLGFHEAVAGNLGPWVGPVSTAQLTGKSFHLVVEMLGDEVTATLSDEHSQAARTGCSIGRLVKAGGVGLYHDASVPCVQRFDHFRLERLQRVVPANAVQVLIPGPIAEAAEVWPGGPQLRVQGVAGKYETPRGALSLLTVDSLDDIVVVQNDPAAGTLFPDGLPNRRWIRFPAQGLAKPACGVIYRSGDKVTNGLALGGIDTGCLDLETSGLLGYSTIFNTHIPRRGPLNLPVFGLSVGGKTWVLCKPQPKQGEGGAQIPVEPVLTALNLEGVETARGIQYWGHYPVADLEFDTDAPVGVSLRAWSPFLPGDVVNSMVPGIVFEVQLRNASDAAQQGTLAFSFPGPTRKEIGEQAIAREEVTRDYRGVCIRGELASYVMGVVDEQRVRVGGELGADGQRWSAIGKPLPTSSDSDTGASVAVDFVLAPREAKTVRFVAAWHAPTWKGGGYNWAGGNLHRHMYAKHYPSAISTAGYLAKNHSSLLRRILAWQEVVYTDDKLPVWLRDSLVNILYCLSEDSFWAQKQSPLPDWVREEDGLFGLCESPRGCPQIECIPCSFYGSQPLVYFFPELQLSTIRGYQGYQGEDGRPPWVFGAPVDLGAPGYTQYQASTNGISLAGIVDRYLMCCDTPDKRYTKEFYPMLKRCMSYNVTLGQVGNPSYSLGEQVMALPNIEGNLEWFETQAPGWQGVAAHIGILRLAQLQITERLAREVGDTAYAEQCAEWTKLAVQALEQRLWDQRGYYLNFLEPTSQTKSEFVFGYQLDGEWVMDHHGLPSSLPVDRVRTVLDTIQRTNVALSKSGAVNYANPDGSVANPGGYGAYSYFPPELMMLGMNYMYEGQVPFGTELVRKMWHNIVCLQGYTWDVPNIMRGDVDTGERVFGNDYYQDLMLWSLPAALAGQDFAAPTKPGGLVDRILAAARADQ
ncbi:MAG: GH116 family glycosyl-hydrolase [Pirellulaceae bacterium]